MLYLSAIKKWCIEASIAHKTYGMRHYTLLITLLLTGCLSSLHSQEASPPMSHLQNEILLHPADGFTAYTLQKGEFVYNQSPFTFPIPSWAWWGITDRITAEIDLLPLIGGVFQEPYRPVPSFNFRFRLRDQKGIVPTIAYETMYQHLWNTQNQMDQDHVRVDRQGNSWYNRLNFSWRNSNNLHIHLSTGLTYTENLLIENKNRESYQGKYYDKTVNPDISLSLDWRVKPGLSTHLTTSYGTTFVYLDNIPRKYQLSYGFRVAPFYKSKVGILRTFRAEFIGFYMWLPDAGEGVASVLPIFPYFYWQFKF